MRRRQQNREPDNGFAAWGGYMEAKKTKLIDQYQLTTVAQAEKKSDIFKGIAILVNGLTNPNSDELKELMAQHGGTYHMYQSSTTTHIVASNLPNVKINKLGPIPIVKPCWITDSITLNKLLDYRRYLLYTNQTTTQPRLDFPVVPKQHSTAPTKTASDPNFIEEFYNNSRLHLIATLGAEFKHLVGKLREESDGKFPGIEELCSNATRDSAPVTDFPVVMHIDMDCFFVSVGLKNRPELRGKPVAVTHARNPHIQANKDRVTEITMNLDRLPQKMEEIDANSSLSEIACCSYEARKCGVKNGMFLGSAVKLCPELKTIPYDFQDYRDVSKTLYETIASYTLDIEAVSCDEMYVDVSKILKTTKLTVEEWATHIRDQIRLKTACPCSTGFGANRLQARLATKRAKPDGQYHLRLENVEEYFAEITLSDIPGVGYATLSKLRNLDLRTCGDIQTSDLSVLQTEFGQKLGETLWEQARGIDKRPLNFCHERKSVSAEINYGIRFKIIDEAYQFLESLAVEVCNRLNDINMRARGVTLKLMIRSSSAPVQTAKFLGHGICDCLSKSVSTGPISDPKSIFREVKQLYNKVNPKVDDLRGMGIQLTKLEKNVPINNALSKFLAKADKLEEIPMLESPQKNQNQNDNETIQHTESVSKDSQHIESPQKKIIVVDKIQSKGKKLKTKVMKTSQTNNLNDFFKVKRKNPNPKLQSIDLNILKELPEDIRQEIMAEYQLETFDENAPGPSHQHQLETPSSSASELNKSPFSGLKWPQLKKALYDWMKSEQVPLEIDVQMLADHFKQLAIGQEIEMLYIAFKFLHRNFEKLNCNWHHAYFNLVNVAQEGMVARYGSTLCVERDFQCCQNL